MLSLHLTIATLVTSAAQRARAMAAEAALTLGSQLMAWGLYARPERATPSEGARAVEAVRRRVDAHPQGLRGVVNETIAADLALHWDAGDGRTRCGFRYDHAAPGSVVDLPTFRRHKGSRCLFCADSAAELRVGETCCGSLRTAITEHGSAVALGCLACGSELGNTLPSIPAGMRVLPRARWDARRAAYVAEQERLAASRRPS